MAVVAAVASAPEQRVAILVLETVRYREVSTSLALPPLTSDVLTRFLEEHRSQRWLAWIRAIRAWVREQATDGAANA